MVASNAKFYMQDNRVIGILREFNANGVEWVKIMPPDLSTTFADIQVSAKKADEIEFAGTLYLTECRAAGIDPEKMRVFAQNCTDRECRPFLTLYTWTKVVTPLPPANPWKVYFSTGDLVEILEANRNDCRSWKAIRDKLYSKIALRQSYLWG